jgi:hypothetical protein
MTWRGWTVFFALILGACGDRTPSSPSGSAASNVGANPNLPPPSGVVAGRVVDALTGDPVGSARVSVAGAPAIPVQADGTFRAELSSSYHVSVVVEAPDYWSRETHMRSTGDGTVSLDILPEGRDFNLGFFDHVFRELGESGTHPWSEEPEFVIWENLYECTKFVEEHACDEIKALEQPAPASFIKTVRDVIAQDARQYSNGAVRGWNVSTRSHPPGTVLQLESFIESGKVSFAMVVRPDDYSWSFWQWGGDSSMIGGHVHINRAHRDIRGVYSHELAHTLGFNHPLGLDRVPLPSIMRRGHGDGPTRIDRLHASVLYRRPPNSRTPDVDPPSYSLNGLRLAGAPPDAEGTGSAP